MDDKDRKLIALLRRNARAPIVSLARGIGLSRSATQDRIARLEAIGVIAGYTVALSSAPDYQSAHLLVRLKGRRSCERIAPMAKAIPYVTRVDSVAGEIDLLVSVDADTLEAVEDVRRRVAGIDGVADVTTAVVIRRHL